MSDLIKTLKSSSTGDDVYPNIKEDNIPSGAVTSAKIGTSAVITGKINDGAVTTNKVSDGAITYEKLALALKNLIDGKASNYDLSLVQSALSSHTSNTSNPHSVTKAQVGLGNVDNTSDANKPVSTATQGALDLKADKSTTYTKTEVDTALSGKDNVTNNPFINDGDGWYLPKDTDEIHINPENFYLGLDATSASLKDVIDNKQNKLYLYEIYVNLDNASDRLEGYFNIISSNNVNITNITFNNFIDLLLNGNSIHLPFTMDSDSNRAFYGIQIFKDNQNNANIEGWYFDSFTSKEYSSFSSTSSTIYAFTVRKIAL